MAKGFWSSGAAAVVLAAAISAPGVSGAQSAHPDLSGIWFPGGGRGTTTPNPLPYNDAVKKLQAEYQAQFTLDDDPGRYCIWPGMPRAIWGAPFSVEIIQRPQDISIYWEGYGMYRKIYMADRSPPKPVLPSAMGHSVAHWEGETLVVETTNLKPYPYMTRLATSSAARVVERMHVEEREIQGQKTKVLVNEVTLTDPKVFTEPVRIVANLQFRPDLNLIEYTCTDTLWDEYLTERGLTLPDLDALPGGEE
jgi:hypothetical protein